MTDGVIDMTALNKLLEVIGGDPEDLQDLIDEFENTTPEIMAQIQAAGSARDWSALRVSTHSLKSSGRDFGAMDLATLCERLEHACKAETVTETIADEQIDAIGRALDAARRALGAVRVADV